MGELTGAARLRSPAPHPARPLRPTPMVAMRHPLFAFVLALLTSLALATSARAQTTTWYVSNGLEFGHFDTIQGAVDAAADGDLILVRRGHYPAFTVDDKALTIAGEGTARRSRCVDGSHTLDRSNDLAQV